MTGPRPRRVALLVAVLAVALALGQQLLVAPVVGIADNGDYFRLFDRFGLWTPLQGDERFFAYLIREWGIDPARARATGFWSTDLGLLAASFLVNPVFASAGQFDIRSLGLVRAVLFVAGAFMILGVANRAGRSALVAATLALVVVFCDVGYAAYFNSGYTEASSLLFGLLAIAFFLRLATAEAPARADLAGFAIASILLIMSKPQNILMALPLALAALRFVTLDRTRAWRNAVIVAAACVAVTGLAARLLRPPPLYQEAIRYIAVFNAILPASPDRAGDLVALGADATLADLSGVYPWEPRALARTDDLQRGFYAAVSERSILRFHLTHPGRMVGLLRLAAGNALHLRPDLGNFEAASGRGPYARSRSFAWRTDFMTRWGPASLSALAGVAVAVLLVASLARAMAVTRTGQLLAEGVAWLLLLAATQYVVVALLQGHLFGAKGMVIFAFFFDATVVAALALAIALALGAVRRGRGATH